MKFASSLALERAIEIVGRFPGITSSAFAAHIGVTATSARLGLEKAVDQGKIGKVPIADGQRAGRTKLRWAYYPIDQMPRRSLEAHYARVEVVAFTSGRVLSLERAWRGGPAGVWLTRRVNGKA